MLIRNASSFLALVFASMPLFIQAQLEREMIVEVFSFTRFVTTDVTILLNNDGDFREDFEYPVVIPQTAFVTNYTMVFDNGDEITAEIEERSAAAKTLEQAIRDGKSASTVSNRGTNEFDVKVTLEKKQSAEIRLTYQEVLEREYGVNRLFVHIPSYDDFDNFALTIGISEPNQIDIFHIPEPAPDLSKMLTERLLDEPNIITTDQYEGGEIFGDFNVDKIDDDQASLRYIQWDRPEGLKDEAEDLVILYAPEQEQQEVIQTVDGYFVHFITPDEADLTTGDKNLVFVMDRSGSMKGRKWAQVKAAMEKILYQLGDSQVDKFGDRAGNDKFSIILFGTDNEVWENSLQDANDPVKIQAAVDWMKSKNAAGWTNISGALKKAIDILRTGGTVDASGIIFLTDGLPTRGTTDKQQLIDEIYDANRDENFHIHTLAFGSDADYSSLQKISADNFGLARKIYVDSDAEFQLEGFYQEVAQPMISNLEVSYVDGNMDPESLVLNTNSPLADPGKNGKRRRKRAIKGSSKIKTMVNKGKQVMIAGRTKKEKKKAKKPSRRSSRRSSSRRGSRFSSRFSNRRNRLDDIRRRLTSRSSSSKKFQTVDGRVKGDIVKKTGQRVQLNEEVKCRGSKCQKADKCRHKFTSAQIKKHKKTLLKPNRVTGEASMDSGVYSGAFCQLKGSAKKEYQKLAPKNRVRRQSESGTRQGTILKPSNSVTGFIQRFWASLTLQRMIDEAEYETDNGKKRKLESDAISMSKKYNMVTPLTSFVVVEGRERTEFRTESFEQAPNPNAGQNEGINFRGSNTAKCTYKVCVAIDGDKYDMNDQYDVEDAKNMVDRLIANLPSTSQICILVNKGGKVKLLEGFKPKSAVLSRKLSPRASQSKVGSSIPGNTRLIGMFTKGSKLQPLFRSGFTKQLSYGVYIKQGPRDSPSAAQSNFWAKTTTRTSISRDIKKVFDSSC